MTNKYEPTSEQFSSEGMPTIPLRPQKKTTNINRVFSACIAIIVCFIAIGHDLLGQFVTGFLVPQLVFIIGLGILAFVMSVVWRWYWLCIVALTLLGTAIPAPWLATIGGTVVGISGGVTFMVVYGISRAWFERDDTWPFVVSAVSTVYAVLALAAHVHVIPDAGVLPLLLVGVAGLFVRQLRQQNVL